MIMKNKRLQFIILTIAFLLLVPFLAMQFTDQVNWTTFDFIVAGALLLGIGLIFDLLIRKIKNVSYRIAISIILLIVFLLIWIELAVGIFGTPFSGS
jgi:hypothetical protein